MICVDEIIRNFASKPLNRIEVAFAKFAPVKVTIVPVAPDAGERLVRRGATTKLAELVAVPTGVLALIVPVVAPVGTIAVN